ncbi:RagB/SusD family nutrient uptake outer membrane protein [Bacteroides faecichinchillae]|nr:RagB/SusD family nutrient uptake outer membrane protein [Bacteroides faecichinchillae]
MLIIALATGITSCSYLDIIPDNIPTIDMAFADRASAEKYLFTCYSYIPAFYHPDSDPAMLGSGEIHIFDGGRNSRANLGLITGEQNVNEPVANYWDGYMFNAIRDCNIFLEKVDGVHDLSQDELKRWKGEVIFLKAYYHYLLLRAYGPIPLMDENIEVSAPAEAMAVGRIPFDSCVNYVNNLLEESAGMLPLKVDKETTEAGRVTKSVALTIRAQLLTMAASPLFNGNIDYTNVIDRNGVSLFNVVADPKKWERAAKACQDAIEETQLAKRKLYEDSKINYYVNDVLKLQCNLKSILFDRWNEEVIWGSTRTDVRWIQTQVMPRLEAEWTLSSDLNGEVCPTLELAETFYSENGVPIEEDVTFEYSNRYKTRQAREEEKWYVKKGEETAILHFNREPRFYAAIGFDRGIWWGNGRFDLEEELYYLQIRAGEAAGLRAWERLSQTGYFCKKLVDPETIIDKDNFTSKTNYFPLIRLADLYLMYSEVLNETKAAPDAEVYYYIDEVRRRAGLKGVVESWKNYSNNPNKPLTQKGMREIIHRERQIELALEGKSFWDLRRWKEGLLKWNKPIKGWNIHGDTAEDFYNPIVIQRCSFSTRDYLWPLKEYDLIVNKNLCQNYGW